MRRSAKFLGLPKKKLNIIKKAIRVYNSAPQTDQTEAGWSIDEMLMDGRTKTPDTEMVETDDLKHVMHLLDKMDQREATVLRMRFGLDDEEPKTLKEIGECLGPDPRTRPPDRERGAGEAERVSDGRITPLAASAQLTRLRRKRRRYSANAISSTLKRIVPRGTEISATSPFFLPIKP